MIKLPLILLLALLAAGCERDSSKSDGATASPYRDAVQTNQASDMRMKDESARGAVAGVAASPPEGLSSTAEVQPMRDASGQITSSQLPMGGSVAPTMIIRNGDAIIEVAKVDDAIIKVRQLATQLGGYVANSSVTGGRDQTRQAMLELKIPAARYDQAIAGLGTLGKVETVNSTAQDVGEEFVDVTARVSNAKRLEDRLVALLANRTGKLDEVLRVERELARVREEIERYEGRLRYLTTRVAISTLNITVHEPVSVLGRTPGQNPIAEAIRRAWQNFVGFIAGMIALLGILIPLGALAVVAWFAWLRFRRKS